MLVALLVNTFAMLNMEYTVSSQIPIYISVYYPELSNLSVGCLLSIFAVGYLIAAPLIGIP
jgi:predicted MFS family arabinose efflux permease